MPQLKSSILQAANDPKAFIHFPIDSMVGYPIESYLYSCCHEFEYKNYGYNLAMHASLTCLLLAMVLHMERQWLYTAHGGYAARGRLY